MDLSKLGEVLAGEPGYRLKQAKKAIFQDLVEDWGEVTSLPLSLRERLNRQCPLSIAGQSFASPDQNAVKGLITLADGLKVESVLIRHRDGRNTVCVSSQVGCPLACSFCATGRMGFKRDLGVFEIVSQVLFFARRLKKEKEAVTNVVFMGMGEPFLNYENVLGAVRVLNDREGFNLGARRISISTVGIIEGIEKLAEEKLQVNLAISLHAADDRQRSRMMPVNQKYPLRQVLAAVEAYRRKTKRRVMFEYLMVKGVNDSDEDARKLARLMTKPLSFVNLISYNPTGIFKPSPASRIKTFKEILEKEGVVVTQRYRFGREIEAACGQLAGRGR